MSIPVYLSRHQAGLPKPYGAFINWKVGERVTLISKHGRPPADVTVLSETRTSSSAPVIHGARGAGRWVREVDMDGDVFCVSEEQITFGPQKERKRA